MRTIDDYCDEAIRKNNLPSDRQLSFALGFKSNNVTYWRTKKAWPTDTSMVKLSELAGIPRREGLIDLGYWRTSGTIAAPIYKKIMQQIAVASVAIAIMGSPDAHASCGEIVSSGVNVSHEVNCLHYIHYATVL